MDGTLDQKPCYVMLQQKHQVSNNYSDPMCHPHHSQNLFIIIIMLFANIEWFSNDCKKSLT